MSEGSYRGLNYRLHQSPTASAADSQPLLVMLHGCTQTAREFARATGMNDLANRHGFFVVYPEQTERNNRWQCWNFFKPGDTLRGQGEIGKLAGLTRRLLDDYGINPSRVYVAGFSAGGAMASTLAFTYPELYAAVGIHSGLQFRAARSVKGVIGSLNGGAPDPVDQAHDAFHAMGNRARPIPTMVIHGKSDTVVEPLNGRQAARQAVETIRLATQQQRTDSPVHYRLPTHPTTTINRRTTYTFDRNDYRFADGRLAVRYLAIRGLGHLWSGGMAGESYVAPDAPDASRRLWQFFDRHTHHGIDARVNTPPVVSLTANRTTLPTGDTLVIRAKASDIDGSVSTIHWRMGERALGEKWVLRHRFRKTGTHEITVTVTDDSGTRKSRSLVVTARPPGSEGTLPSL